MIDDWYMYINKLTKIQVCAVFHSLVIQLVFHQNHYVKLGKTRHESMVKSAVIKNLRTIFLAPSCMFKVPITPKYFIRLNNSLHLFEKHCAFLHLFSPNLDFLQAVKVTNSDHHLYHDQASKGYGSIPGLMSQTYLHACLQRLNTMQISL